MNEAKKLIQQITEGIQDKKGKKIIVADLTKIGDTICNYFVICQGSSPNQVAAIVESVKDFTRKGADSKPFAIDGLRNAEWVAMDYSDVLVHVFLPETREFLILEHFGLSNFPKSPTLIKLDIWTITPIRNLIK